ncbi:hypothetical protein HYV50_05715 [Candidatus Pacearchaeota archaeon]|nr:hypothetical protein [Candidatus Pacearchaeota archaeon]
METRTITINIEAEVLKKLRRLAQASKQKKGFLGKTITEATRDYIKEKEQEKIRKSLLRKLEQGYYMGKWKIKKREELYDRV